MQFSQTVAKRPQKIVKVSPKQERFRMDTKDLRWLPCRAMLGSHELTLVQTWLVLGWCVFICVGLLDLLPMGTQIRGCRHRGLVYEELDRAP